MARTYDDPREAATFARGNQDGLPDEAPALLASRLAVGARVLVAGCGTGCEALALSLAGYRVTALDRSETMIRHARQAAAALSMSLTFHVDDLMTVRWPAPSLPFDLVYLCDTVYSHLPTAQQRRTLLLRIREWLPPGGWLVMDRSFYCLPERAWYSRSLWVDRWRALRQRLVPTWNFPEPGDRMIPAVSPESDPRQPCFVHFFRDAEEVRRDLRSAGFQPVAEAGRFWLWQLAVRHNFFIDKQVPPLL